MRAILGVDQMADIFGKSRQSPWRGPEYSIHEKKKNPVGRLMTSLSADYNESFHFVEMP